MQTPLSPEPAPSRRQALKIGAATAAGLAVWAEPTIKGLASRPAYAQACSAGGGVTTLYEAENAVLSGVSVDTNHTPFSGTGFANFSGTGSATFNNIEGGCGGTATLIINNALNSGPRTGTITVNGVAQSFTFPRTGNSWSAWQDSVPIMIPLNPGATNTIVISSTGSDLANIDYITVTTAP